MSSARQAVKISLKIAYELLKAVEKSSDIFPPLKAASSATLVIVEHVRVSLWF